nr:uncharacterized protein LOC104104659 [Nicotiana tomentosiformis]
MDGKKKRKRTDNGEANGGDRNRHERESAANEDIAVAPPPSEAEVNEFFAILRRMHVAVKYLQKSGQKRVVPKGDLDLNTLPENGD